MIGLGSPVVMLIPTGWMVILATAMIVFRRPAVNVLLRFAAHKDDAAKQRRNMTAGVLLLAVYVYALGGTVTAMSLLPTGAMGWPAAVGMPACALLAILSAMRFSNAGLSVLGWLRR